MYNAVGLTNAILLADAQVAALVGTRAFPLIAPDKTALPYIVASTVNVSPNDNKTGPSGLDEIMIQVDAYAGTYDRAQTIATLCRDALDYYRGLYTLNSIAYPLQDVQYRTSRDFYDSEARIYRYSSDYVLYLGRSGNVPGAGGFASQYHDSDADAIAAGLSPGQVYRLTKDNIYGLPYGIPKFIE